MFLNTNNISKNVILGNGTFPKHPIPLQILQNAHTIICCDGAANELLKHSIEPTIIIGDLDSINNEAKQKFAHKLIQNSDQNTNDQTKAIQWAFDQGITDVIILGATGKREDHTMGNVSLLLEYCSYMKVEIISDSGIFTPITQSAQLQSFVGQKISIFSITPFTQINSTGLKYPLQNLQLQNWWMGTLNESISDTFSLNFEEGKLLVFRAFGV